MLTAFLPLLQTTNICITCSAPAPQGFHQTSAAFCGVDAGFELTAGTSGQLPGDRAEGGQGFVTCLAHLASESGAYLVEFPVGLGWCW